MASYQVEHGIPEHEANDAPPHSHRRPDLSTFFSTFELIDTSNTTNSNAIPTPGDLSAAFRSLAEAYDMMRQEGGSELLDILAERLYENAEAPPREVQGVNDEFLAELERVPKKSIKPTDSCPICSNPFLEDEYPLVVRLPCHKSHIFDLECITPWLKLHDTCPLDRKDLAKKKDPPKPPNEEEEEEEWEDMYA